ncbi:hypothetical protein PRIPAC_81064 [Pristionchus pacificus]|uniref:Uncharacterized protein n=1 Tax=Pristionchus pacificus TaxID=54126 RepID=A0A2A6CKF9_PRIPA|nr:hypothetical protein PRIPAC_81064 [Pristionchus pacificus]|eukprot:PDM78543.1 hypothetical protein PRIPAC_31122 [Pristionchus pacificus]
MATEQFQSLSEDDFEVIQSGVDSTYRSVDPSLNDSLVLHPMLVSTATLVDDSSIRNEHPTVTNETGLLNCSISMASSQSSDALSTMLRSQSETLSLMEKQLQEFSIIQESIKANNSLQLKIDELSSINKGLEKDLEETRNQLISLKTISDSIQSNVKQEVDDEEEVLYRAPSFDEVEKLRHDNENLSKRNAELSGQLSEEYAKRLNERELRRTLQNSVDSMSLTGSISVENQQVTRALQELMSKSDECEQLKAKVRELEAELASCKIELDNSVAIIGVLQEENTEGTRMLADNRRKIDDMKRTLEKYGHFSDF